MKNIQLTLYSFDELSTEVQKQIIERERWNVMTGCMDCYESGYRSSLEKFEKIFDIKSRNWSVDYCAYYYDFDIIKGEAFEWWNGCIELETLSGKLLQRYLQTNILPHVENGKYYGKIVVTYPNSKHVKRYSKIIKEIDCPFTGFCYDMYLIDPLLAYLKSPSPNKTYRDVIGECLDSFFKHWHREYKYWADDEDAIRDELHINQYGDRLYHENGDVYNGPLN